MSDFKAKMRQIRFPLGLRPRPPWRSLQRSPRPLAVFKGSTYKRRGKEDWKGRGLEERKGKGGNGMEGGDGRKGEGDGSMHPLRFSKVGAYEHMACISLFAHVFSLYFKDCN